MKNVLDQPLLIANPRFVVLWFMPRELSSNSLLSIFEVKDTAIVDDRPKSSRNICADELSGISFSTGLFGVSLIDSGGLCSFLEKSALSCPDSRGAPSFQELRKSVYVKLL
jgi:hypothetical protein